MEAIIVKQTSKKGLTKDEIDAMKERVKELDEEEVDGERAVLAKIAEMKEPGRKIATRIHEIIKTNAPSLEPKPWYGMPAYAIDGKVIFHFQPSQKFKTRYPTIGFSDKANLDDGKMWPVGFAIKELTSNEEKRIADLIRRAVS